MKKLLIFCVILAFTASPARAKGPSGGVLAGSILTAVSAGFFLAGFDADRGMADAVARMDRLTREADGGLTREERTEKAAQYDSALEESRALTRDRDRWIIAGGITLGVGAMSITLDLLSKSRGNTDRWAFRIVPTFGGLRAEAQF